MLLFNLYCGRPNIENMTDITSKVKNIYTKDIKMIDEINKIIVNNKITFDDCTIDGKLYLLPTGNDNKIELLSKLNFLGDWSIQTTNYPTYDSDTLDIKYNNESKIHIKTNNNDMINSSFPFTNDLMNVLNSRNNTARSKDNTARSKDNTAISKNNTADREEYLSDSISLATSTDNCGLNSHNHNDEGNTKASVRGCSNSNI